MDEAELMEHISGILYYGNERNIALSLTELRDILKRKRAPEEQIRVLSMAAGMPGRMAEFSMLSFGEKISWEKFCRAVERFSERRGGGMY